MGETRVNWYLASLVRGSLGSGPPRRCHALIAASDSEQAYRRASALGASCGLPGVEELLRVHEEPTDGSELVWSEAEVDAAEAAGGLPARSETRAFREGAGGGGWYLGRVVLREVHDEGSHGDTVLFWSNSYLVRAVSAEEAYRKAERIGAAQRSEPASHRCGGEAAHWEFTGIEDLIPLLAASAAGQLLWCDEGPDLPAGPLPAKSELAVFAWKSADHSPIRKRERRS